MYQSASIFIALLAAVNGGCAFKACTMIGCESTLTVSFTSRLPPGSYQIELTAPDSAPCEVTSDGSGEKSDYCADFGYVHLTPTALIIDAAKENVSVRILRASVLVGEGSFTPEYAVHQPNGPDCEPLCQTATVDLALTGLETGAVDSANDSN
jgi:hypothetical protein